MPVYEYLCEANGAVVEVAHPMDVELTTWGELCYVARIPLGETDVLAPVRKQLSAPAIAVSPGNSELKGMGFTKLVRRDDGVYENVTRSGDEARYMERGRAGTMPDLRRKVRD